MKTLIITEKPSVGKDIASVLGNFERKDGYLENSEYIVSWAFGHLVELADPSIYNPALKKWDLATLPIIPENFKMVEIAGSSAKQLRVLKKLLNLAEVSQVINGCDAGREGESIFRRIYHFCGCRKPIKRLWLSETTPTAVKDAMKALREGQEYNNLAAAAEARGQADWLVGLNGTRAFSVRHNAVLSVGRVQTPTLNLIVSREREIKNFVPVPYWEIWGVFQTSEGTYKGKWFREKKDRLPNKEEALNLTTKLSAKSKGRVISLEQKEAKELPPFLFNLNDLQKEGNRRHGFTAQQVLDLAQALYEKHKLLTYPRTDSRHLSTAMISTLSGRLTAIKNAPMYITLVPDKLAELSKRNVDDGKITDHHAIIPTAVDPTKTQLSDQEKKIYDLVVRRFLSIFYPEARYAVTEVLTETAGEKFKSRGRVELAAGWKMVWRDSGQETTQETTEEGNGDDPEDQALPPLTQGDSVDVSKVEILEKQTKPPKRYTEATILAAMESAGRFANDKELAEVLKGTGGIGTPATRAATIERLIKVGYIIRDKKALIPIEKGQTLIDLVPEQLKSVELTAAWEDGLRRIENGQQSAALWIKDIQDYTRELVVLARNQEAAKSIDTARTVLGKCPVCGRDVVETAKSYGCSGYREGCKFAIWKEINSKKISAKQAEVLLTKGKTGLIKGFESKVGKTFDAILQLGEEGKITFGFANAANDQSNVAIGKCPLCGKDVVENSRSYGCRGYKDGCKFAIWKEIAKKKITEKQAAELLTKGKTGVIKGFTGQKGSFDAALSLVNGEVKFAFAERK